jgi:hypothetical protein
MEKVKKALWFTLAVTGAYLLILFINRKTGIVDKVDSTIQNSVG